MTRRAAIIGTIVLSAAVTGCAAKLPQAAEHRPLKEGMAGTDIAVPPFARAPYEPISATDVVAIATREWRLFGQPIDDDPPGTRPPPLPEEKPEREPGLWERVGEYWWIALGPDARQGAWTGEHDETGYVFRADEDAKYAWSAAFVSYVMRVAGAGNRFPYSENHSDYINIARESGPGSLLTAMRLTDYAPVPGDLICEGRGRRGARLTFDDLPTQDRFPSHCDIVVAHQGEAISVIGGNVDDAVTMKHVPVTPDGKLATPDGTVLDTRYTWLTVLRVNYSAPPALAGPTS
jgi:hypothetical protein